MDRLPDGERVRAVMNDWIMPFANNPSNSAPKPAADIYGSA